ncbi:restriction endonuclease subunit S [Arthrobacter sp. 3Tela_A]|uniref:restriction endonuclease subunit S n=1 Tax=Arthrobacter sp. 3Tela_A TaxID=3093743 RepID=UPI003BB4FCFC
MVWVTKTVEELCQTVTSGGTPNRSHPEFYSPPEIPWIKTGELTDGLVTRYEESISQQGLANSSAKLLPSGTILMAMYGATVGKLGILSSPATCNQASCALIADPEVCHGKWLFYALLNDREHIVSRANGAAQQNLSGTTIKSFSYAVPSVSEQRAIAEVLGALDDKIAANSKLAETSSTTSQALFQQLIAASSELTTLGELLNLEYGKALPAAKRAHGHVAVYGSGGVVGAHNEALKDGPGIVVGRKGSAGMVYWSPGPFFPIDTTYYVDPKLGSETLPFCYHVLKSLRLAEMNSDSAVPGLNRAEALATKVQKVDYPAISNFCAAAAPLFELAAEYEQENRTLAATRDALLPQLMSGKLRVKDIENTMGEMV